MPLTVTVVERGGGRRRAASGLGAWLARSAPRGARGEVAVAIVSSRAVQALNKRFRGADKPTDVLSFPEREAGKARVGRRKGGASSFLGEIVIARGVAVRQARALGHSTAKELRILALHGLLHLLGYDHEVDNGQMARLEERLRRRAGLPAGLIGRTS